ncbi:uncharacterized protein TNIN_441331 [Trichonephila inaurata madagascariensis]|uniref:Uncharacterized protein n=1 Tax=Trichonephila inaurata madagascariensis TaxID=2747483 RepID=A0A8X6XIJ6_9ARAC|nr:uncharacterized protein TNIN_441331 [Trichonephila inaurata madagascariensis]
MPCSLVPVLQPANTIDLSSLSGDYSCHFEELGQVVICDMILANKRGSHFKEFLKRSGLTAFETKLGWTVIGSENYQSSSLLVTSMLLTSVCISELWALDSLGITNPSEKKTTIELQAAVKQNFLGTVRIENDRFVVN